MPRRIIKRQSSKDKGTGLSASQERLLSEIQKRAYWLYEGRGCVSGNDWADWFTAEKQVREGMKV
ncbi:MAG: DUF2934 domain-containing protein [Candidatus Omnitrophota bacterium]